MSAYASNGSPPPRSRRSTQFVIHEDAVDIENADSSKPKRPKASKTKVEHAAAKNDMDETTMDALFAKLNEGQAKNMVEPGEAVTMSTDKMEQEVQVVAPLNPTAISPVSDALSNDGAPAPSRDDVPTETQNAEMVQLKRELELAKEQLELQKRELDEN
ncbi:MAG: hypothetical protein Q9198_005613, partial [Flavoplaca austrocitrina]